MSEEHRNYGVEPEPEGSGSGGKKTVMVLTLGRAWRLCMTNGL